MYARFDPLIPPALNLNIISLGSRHASRSQGFLDITEEWGAIALHVGNDYDPVVFSAFDLYNTGREPFLAPFLPPFLPPAERQLNGGKNGGTTAVQRRYNGD